MLKLMIVEDEFFVRRGITESIDWKLFGIEVCGEAADGEEALELALQLGPDIILTDIKMGKMNGLEFINQCQHILPEAKFVILSGHDDFEYARKAISLGVSEYLLKPIGAEELIASITKLMESIQKEEERQSAKDFTIQNSLMLSWNLPQASLPIETSWFQVVLFSLDNPKETSFGSAMQKAGKGDFNVQLLVQDYFNLAGINHIVKRIYENMYMVMLNYAVSQPDSYAVTGCLREYMQKECNAQLTVGMGSQYQGYHKINTSYNEAFSALGYKYAFAVSADIHVNQIPSFFVRPYMHHAQIQGFKKDIQTFVKAFRSEVSSLDKLLKQLFQKIERQELKLEERKTLCLKICILCLNVLDNKSYAAAERMRVISLMDMEKAVDSEDIYNRMQQILTLVCDTSSTSLTGNYQSMIDIVIRYVHAHYGDNVSLQLLAGVVHVTPNYLSRIFKETVGENFKEWLTRYRIEKSKELLLDSSLKMYEIAVMVGFSDYKHFSATFKKLTGCSAKEYRISVLKLHS